MNQSDLIFSYYKKHPNRDIPHKEVVDWATAEYKKNTGKTFRDPDRAIRKLAQTGQLIKVSKGIYRYDPELAKRVELEDFSQADKKKVLERDDYKCVICGMGEKDGVELHVDHIKAKDKGGKATVENGQVLCSKHNNLKKNYKQTETGKRMFINLLNKAKKSNDRDIADFCEEILETYEKFGVNGHIKWKE